MATQILPSYQVAGLGTRIIAFVLDYIALVLTGVVVGLIQGALFGPPSPEVQLLTGTVVWFIYCWYFWTRKNGQTPGKRTMGIRVVKTDGSPITTGSALARFIGYYLNSIVLLFGWVQLIFDSQRQGWHDKLADTIVVTDIPAPTRAPATDFTSTPPFSLAGIILTSILMSPLAAGIMAAVNWRRLGREDRSLPTIILSVAAIVAIVFLFAWLPGDVVPLVVAIGFYATFPLLLARWQRADYLTWVTANNGVRPRLSQSGCSTYLAILVGSFLLGISMWGFISGSVIPMALSLRPQNHFTGDNFTLSYPGSWFPLEFNPGVCNVAGTDCLLAVAPLFPSQDFSLDMIRIRALLFPYVLEQVDEEVWIFVQSTFPDAELESVDELEVDGRRAIRRIVNVSQGSETWMFLLIQDGSDILRLRASGTTPSFIQHRQELEDTIASINFMGVSD